MPLQCQLRVHPAQLERNHVGPTDHYFIILGNQKLDTFAFFEGAEIGVFKTNNFGLYVTEIHHLLNLVVITFRVDLQQVEFMNTIFRQQSGRGRHRT